MIAQEHIAEVQDTDSAALQAGAGTTLLEQVEPGTTWREALLARLHPADHRISDEDIFAILNAEADGRTAAELCAESGVTVPMYCVWRSKYRQLGLDELRLTRRREQRRRYAAIGVMLLVATLSLGGIVVGLSWAVISALMDAPAASSAIAAAAPARDFVPVRVSVAAESPNVATPVSEIVKAEPHSRPEVEAPAAETGYRIQVATADSEQQGLAMVAKLVSAGYPAYITHAVVDNRNVIRVRVGPFETLPDASKTATDLRSAGYAGVWIAR